MNQPCSHISYTYLHCGLCFRQVQVMYCYLHHSCFGERIVNCSLPGFHLIFTFRIFAGRYCLAIHLLLRTRISILQFLRLRRLDWDGFCLVVSYLHFALLPLCLSLIFVFCLVMVILLLLLLPCLNLLLILFLSLLPSQFVNSLLWFLNLFL